MVSRALLLLTFYISSWVNSQEHIPILAFSGVKTANINDFAMLKEAGFNISLDVYETTQDAVRNLDAAAKSGVKLFIYSDSLMLHPDKVINQIKDHPAFYGTYVADEPPVDKFAMVRWRIEGIKKYDRKGRFYVNLFPNEASGKQLGAISYQHYLEKFADVVQPDFISFDYYPIKNNKVDEGWYKNLEDIRRLSLQINKPFWGFANSTVFGPHLQPTLAGLKLQQFGNLLYGAKGLQYFTYWTQNQEFRSKHNFQHSIVYENGKPTPTYDLVKQLNAQIRSIEWIFLNAEVKNVYHAGSSVPKGTNTLKTLPKNFSVFNVSNESVLISKLEGKLKKFVIVQNKSIDRPITFKYKIKAPTNIINSQTGVEKNAIHTKTSEIILPGDLLIFSYLK